MQEATITIQLDSPPQSKQSVRLGKGRAYTDSKKRAYQRLLSIKIREQFKGKKFTHWAIVYMELGFKRPRRLTKDNSVLVDGIYYKVNTPDYDNLDKPILDAITQAGVWTDDKIAFDGRLVKRYADSNYIHITIKGQ